MDHPSKRKSGKPNPSLMVELWSVNVWLRWTGWRLTVELPDREGEPTRIGVTYWGWAFARKQRDGQ